VKGDILNSKKDLCDLGPPSAASGANSIFKAMGVTSGQQQGAFRHIFAAKPPRFRQIKLLIGLDFPTALGSQASEKHVYRKF